MNDHYPRARTAIVLLIAGLVAPAFADVRMITGGDAGAPERAMTAEGVELLSNRRTASAPQQAATAGASDMPVAARGGQAHVQVIQADQGRLVSPRLTARPGHEGIVRSADPRRAPAVAHDERVSILNQELAREGQDLIDKQRLLRLPRGTDPLADELRERIGREVTQHEASIAALHREIARLVQGQRQAVARR